MGVVFMNKDLHSEMTNLDILKKIHYQVFGVPKKEEKSKEKRSEKKKEKREKEKKMIQNFKLENTQ